MEVSEKIQNLLVEGRSMPHDNEQTLNSKLDGHNFNRNLALEGRKFFRGNFFSIFVAMLSGLLSLMYVNSIVSVLYFTKKSHSPVLAFKRYLGTLLHVIRWYEDLDQMKASLKSVRLQHRNAAVKFGKTNGSGHIGISQFDMVVTQWGFIGPMLLFPRKLGISDCDSEGLEGMVHIMYLVGLELGVKDELNLCYGGLDKARENSREILENVIQPAFNNSIRDEKCCFMASSLLAGINILNPFIDPAAFHAFTLQLFLVSGDSGALSGYSSFIKSTMDLVFNWLLHVPLLGELVRQIGNSLMRLNVFLASDWTDFIVVNFKTEDISIRDRIQAFVAIPVFTVVSGALLVWRNLDRGNVMVVLGFYLVVYVMYKLSFTSYTQYWN